MGRKELGQAGHRAGTMAASPGKAKAEPRGGGKTNGP